MRGEGGVWQTKVGLGIRWWSEIWLEHHRIVTIYVGEPIWLCSSSFALIFFTSFLYSCACDSWVVCCLCNWCIHVSYCVESMINVVLIQSQCKLYGIDYIYRSTHLEVMCPIMILWSIWTHQSCDGISITFSFHTRTSMIFHFMM